jgi:ribosomal protein S18 acetylase RimI-like enzyme
MTQEGSRFGLAVIDEMTFRVDQPGALDEGDWAEMQNLLHGSFKEEIRRHPHDLAEEIPSNAAEYLVAQSVGLFKDRRIDPSLAPDAEGQRFENPQIVRALDKTGTLVGYSHSVNNTSPPFARAKMAIPPNIKVPRFGGRRYARISELAVAPEFQGEGLGTLIAYKTLSLYPEQQPVSAYVYAREFPQMSPALERHGMTRTGAESKDPYGENGGKAVLSRYTAHVGALMRLIEGLPGAKEAIYLMNYRTPA